MLRELNQNLSSNVTQYCITQVEAEDDISEEEAAEAATLEAATLEAANQQEHILFSDSTYSIACFLPISLIF